MGLGPYPLVSLAQAREARDDARAHVFAGRDPQVERARAKGAAPAFEEATTAFLADNETAWRNPKHCLDALLPKPKKLTRGHHRALPYKDMPDFMAQLRTREGAGALALRFAILTAARSGEVRRARWHEFDLDEAVWTVPAERMRGGREHRVPLCEVALSILRSMDAVREGALVFPGARADRPMSDATMAATLKRMGGGRDGPRLPLHVP